MLQFPTNFQPDNVCIDAAQNSNYDVSFVFNGDAMFGAIFRVYDYNTGDIVDSFSFFNSNYFPYKYNEQSFSLEHNMGNIYQNLRDYIIQVQLLQGSLRGEKNVCDMIVTSGKIQNLGDSSVELEIEKGIRDIYEWGYDSVSGLYQPTYNNSRIVAEMQIEINNESHTIISYNPETGIVTLDEAFQITISSGVGYKIYTNYLISPQYFFSCRRVPSLFFNMDYNSYQYPYMFHVQGNAGGWSDDNAVVYYQTKLYWGHTLNIGSEHTLTADQIEYIESNETLIDDSGRIYCEYLDYSTPNCWGDVYRSGDNDETQYPTQCSIYPIVTVKTRNGFSGKVGREYVIDLLNDEVSLTDVTIDFTQERGELHEDGFMAISNAVIRGTVESTLAEGHTLKAFGLYRKEVTQWHFVGYSEPILDYVTLYDTTAPLNTKVEYRIVPINEYGDMYYKGITKLSVTTKSRSIALIGLNLYEDNIYWAGNQWLLEVDINDPTITFNIGNNVHTGYENYPSVSRMGIDYATGNISADLSYMSCPDGKYMDNAELIKAWHKFIKNYDAYLLKDLKGNVFVIQISDNPTVSWKEQDRVRPTTISFNWVEVEDINNIQVRLPNLT